MANEEHLNILKQGVRVWNKWRKEHPEIRADLSGANLHRANLRRADLDGANLSRADLNGADLMGAFLFQADLREAELREAELRGVELIEADLSRAHLGEVNLIRAKLSGANLNEANLSAADLREADLREALAEHTRFMDIDLSTVYGLDTVIHRAPSSIGIDTIYRSKGDIPEDFLRGAGIPEDFITYMSGAFVGKAIQFYSCFISYSHEDEESAKRLHSRLQDEHLRVWFAPEDIRGGKKIHEQIEEAIRYHDKLIVVRTLTP